LSWLAPTSNNEYGIRGRGKMGIDTLLKRSKGLSPHAHHRKLFMKLFEEVVSHKERRKKIWNGQRTLILPKGHRPARNVETAVGHSNLAGKEKWQPARRTSTRGVGVTSRLTSVRGNSCAIPSGGGKSIGSKESPIPR